MKDCSPSIASIVKGDRLELGQCPKNDLEWEHMKNIPYVSATITKKSFLHRLFYTFYDGFNLSLKLSSCKVFTLYEGFQTILETWFLHRFA